MSKFMLRAWCSGRVSILAALSAQIIWWIDVSVGLTMNWIVFDAILVFVLCMQLYGIIVGINAIASKRWFSGSIGVLLGLPSFLNTLFMATFKSNFIFHTGGPPPGF